MARQATPVSLSEPDRKELEKWVNAHRTPQQVAQRCRIILAASKGQKDKDIAGDMQINLKTVALKVGEKSISRRLCEPLERKQHPTAAIDAKFSIPFSVATSLVYKWVTLDNFTPRALCNPEVLSVAEKVTYEIDPAFDQKGSTSGKIEIKLKNGGVRSKHIEFAYGHPQNPIDHESFIAKFINCASYSAKVITDKDLQRIIDMILNLQQLDNILKLTKEL